MTTAAMLIQQMEAFLSEFRELNLSYNQHANNYSEMEKTIGEFTAFVLNQQNEEIWKQVESHFNNNKLVRNIAELREQSAYCVWAMEKYRAMELLLNRQGIAEYFNNIEACIASEFGRFEITTGSKVLLIGAGAFPMTPLLIARKTGAEVVGIDIDPEAVGLARNVVSLLGQNSSIRIENITIDQLDFTQRATHIVFASTIKEKFELLQQLHPLTNGNVVVAMRYGNGLKSLFNYPLQDVDSSLWRIVNRVQQPGNVFDVAIYKKEA
ncbi:Nicotianamine synthase protein [compost metagenome]